MDFATQLLTTLNNGALCLMISVGHRTELFDVMNGMAPATSSEIAAAAKLNERYVREWLGAMVTGRIVDYDPSTKSYVLPKDRAVFLTRAGGADNIAGFAQYIGELGSVESLVIDCFRNGGGVPYEKFPRFHEIMADDSAQSVMNSLESHVIPLAQGLHEKLTAGIRMLDVGCGRGRIITRLAELFPKSTFVGLDFSPEPIAYAQEQVSARGLTNVDFLQGDAAKVGQLFAPESFDLISTFDAIHDQAKPQDVLAGIRRILKTGGVYLMQEIKGSTALEGNMDHPLAPALYTVSCMHCMTVSLAHGGEGLGAMWGEQKAGEYLNRAGFRSIEKHELAHDIQNDWYVIS